VNITINDNIVKVSIESSSVISKVIGIQGPPGIGGGGGATWGSITGNLPDQTDLWNELSNKVNLSEVSVTPSPNKVLRADANGNITVQWLNRGSVNQVLGVSGDGLLMEYKTIQGTTNQVNVSHSAGAITLSTPQNIHTGASPTFAGLTLSGLTAGRVLFAGSGGVISQDSNLFWDNTNKRLGIGTSSPSYPLVVIGNMDTIAQGPLYIKATSSGNYGTAFNLDATAQPNGRTFTFMSGAGYSYLPGGFAIYDTTAHQYRFSCNSVGKILIGDLYLGIVFGSMFNVRGNVSIGNPYHNISAPTDGLIVAGNTGIKTSSPQYACHVNGTLGFAPGTSVTPVNIGDVVFEFTNNTTLTIKAKGSDGVIRSVALTLA
jgi:hypothetical protein